MSSSGKLVHLQKMTGLAGSEHFLLNLGRGLDERGWDLHFGLIEEKNQPVDSAYRALAESGWTVERFPYRKGLLLTMLPSVRSWLTTLQPDLINTHLLHADLLGSLATIGLSPPLVTTKHNDDQFKHRAFYGPFAKLLNQRFDRGIAISNHLKSFHEDHLGISSPQFETIHYGIDTEQFHPRKTTSDSTWDENTTVTFGIVARLTEQKGHSTLLKAFNKLRGSVDQVELSIVGNGPLENKLKKLTDDLNLNDCVTFEGYRNDIDRVMQEFDVFVHPSRWEGFGLVFLEAMASGLPVVATNVSAIPEIVVHNRTGYLVEPDTSSDLAEAMKRLARNADLRDKFGKAGRERTEAEFSVDTMISKYDDFYNRVLETYQ
jgi:glycosyltransferase involved in cell wall biosynthesis